MHRRAPLLTLAGVGVLTLAAYALFPPGARRRSTPPAEGARLEAAIAAIEAGRQSTPLVGEAEAGGDAIVTFLAERADGPVPRLVSDVTGWGEQADGTFDVAAGTMTRVGRTSWYSLRASVAPGARVEYPIADGPGGYHHDPHNPRQAAGPKFGGLPAVLDHE